MKELRGCSLSPVVAVAFDDGGASCCDSGEVLTQYKCDSEN